MRKPNSLLQFDHLRNDMFNRGRSIQPMRVPEVNCIHSESSEAVFTGNGHICSVAAERETRRKWDGAELRGKEDVLALLGIQGEPFADNDLGVALQDNSRLAMRRTENLTSWSYVNVTSVPEGTSKFIRAVKKGKTLRIRNGSCCSRAGKSHSHSTEADPWHQGSISTQRT